MPSRANKQKRFQTDKQTSRNHLESAGGCWWWAGLFGAIALNQGGSESFSLVAPFGWMPLNLKSDAVPRQ
jgi:hypothetical protein